MSIEIYKKYYQKYEDINLSDPLQCCKIIEEFITSKHIENIEKGYINNPDFTVIIYCNSDYKYLDNIALLPDCVINLIIVGYYNSKFYKNLTIFPSKLKNLEILMAYYGCYDYFPDNLEYLRLQILNKNKMENMPLGIKKIHIEDYSYDKNFNDFINHLPNIEILEITQITNFILSLKYILSLLKKIIIWNKYIIEIKRIQENKNIEIKYYNILNDKNSGIFIFSNEDIKYINLSITININCIIVKII